MHSRDEYLGVLQEKYLKAKSREEKTKILDEYCRNTGQARKYVIRKINSPVAPKPRSHKRRKPTYDGQVSLALAQIWEIFDYPCGQRLKSILETELIRLTGLGELLVSEEVALKLKMISPATIDRKLKHQREVLHLLRSRHTPKPGSLPGCQIPIRLTQWDTSKVGYIEMDLVVHCGSSTLG